MIPPLIAELIAKEEGYGIPGALPTRDNNPGDLRHSPHSFHAADSPDAIGQISTAEEGWADLVRQLDIYAQRGLTVAQSIYEWAPPSENDTGQYIAYVVAGLGVPGDTLLSAALQIPGKGVYADEPT
jgi:hypothetical protein